MFSIVTARMTSSRVLDRHSSMLSLHITMIDDWWLMITTMGDDNEDWCLMADDWLLPQWLMMMMIHDWRLMVDAWWWSWLTMHQTASYCIAELSVVLWHCMWYDDMAL